MVQKITDVSDDMNCEATDALMTAMAIGQKIDEHANDDSIHVSEETKQIIIDLMADHIANTAIHTTPEEKLYIASIDPAIIRNYWGMSESDIMIAANTVWDSGAAGDMLVINAKNFTVQTGCTLTINARKGILIYVYGEFINNGVIYVRSRYSCDPAAVGVPSTGLSIIRFKSGSTQTSAASVLTGCGATAIAAEANQNAISGDGIIVTLPRTPGTVAPYTGNSYTTGPGSGGGGGEWGGYITYGGAPTCFSGGAGGGGSTYVQGYSGSSIGGAGGNGNAGYWNEEGRIHTSCGGAGNPGGTGTSVYGGSGDYAIGGLLLLFVRRAFINTGYILASGGNGGSASIYDGAGGGGAGGGSINIFYHGSYSNGGTISANGGNAGYAWHSGYAGGAGRVSVTLIDQ